MNLSFDAIRRFLGNREPAAGGGHALRRPLGLMSCACVTALAILAFLGLAQHRNAREAAAIASHDREAIHAIDAIGHDLIDADDALRVHLQGGGSAGLDSYHASSAAVERRLSGLDAVIDTDPAAQTSVRRLHALGRQKLAEMNRILRLHDARRPAAALEALRSGDDRRLMADIRTEAALLVADEEAHTAERSATNRSAGDRVLRMTWAAEAVVALLFAACGMALHSVFRDRLAAAARESMHRALEVSERRVTSLTDALPALIAYVDRDETYRLTNGRHDRYFQAASGSFVGKTVEELLGPDTYAATKTRIEAVLAGTPQTFETHDWMLGRNAHFLVNYVPDLDADGTVAGFYVMVLDITDRKNAELAQRVVERRLRAITDNVPAIIAHLDLDHRYLLANEGFRRLWGLDPNTLIGKTLEAVRGEAVHRQIAGHLAHVLQGEVRRFEVRELIDGVEHHFQQSLVPDVDAAGVVSGYYSVSFDITDLRRNEQLLMESSARHRTIVEEQSELISLARSDGELIYVNPAYSRLFGLTPAAMIGENLLDFVDAADREGVRDAMTSVLATGSPVSGENRMLGRTGQERWVAWTNTLQRDAHGGATLRSVGRDITEQRRAELALRESEEFLSATGRLAGVGGWHLDLLSHEVYWSEEVHRIHAVPAGYQPTHETAMDFYAAESRPLIKAAVQRGIATGEPWDLELRLVTATGRHLWVRTVGRVQFDAAGRPVKLVGAFQDIDARKLAEIAVEDKERLLRAVTDNLPVMVIYVDSDEIVRFINATGAAWLRTSPTQAVDRHVRKMIGHSRYEASRPHLLRALKGERVELEYRDGARYLQLVHSPDRRAGDGSVLGSFITVTDVTTTKLLQLQLESLARVDTLTGLPNRRQFDEKLAEALVRSERSGQRLAVMFLDIDHFKSINDSLGHAGGDTVLKEFGARLKAAVRDTDVVARLAGDEFVVLLEGLTSADDAAVVAEKVVNSMRTGFDVEGTSLRVTTSLGVGMARQTERPTAEALLACADKALYEAKRQGRDGFRLSNFADLAVAA